MNKKEFNDNRDIAKDIDKVIRRLAKKSDEDKVAIAKEVTKIWGPRKKDWPAERVEREAVRALYDLNWLTPTSYYDHNNGKPLDENLDDKCPRCVKGTLVPDHESNRILCSRCGFEINNISDKNVPIYNPKKCGCSKGCWCDQCQKDLK